MAMAMFNDLSSPLALLSTRRSGKARDMVAPGPDSTQLQQILAIAARVPLGRLGQPEEVAEACFYLCSPAASYVTGHVLDVNGGTWSN